MPYEWIKDSPPQTREVHLWPYRSLPRRGMAWFIAVTAALLALPALVLVGSQVLWGLLPFLLGTVWAIWAGLQRSYKDGAIIEVLHIARDAMHLTRHSPNGRKQEWTANPHWVNVALHPAGGPVPNYLTLRGNGREVELGAFLTSAERQTLDHELRRALRDAQEISQ